MIYWTARPEIIQARVDKLEKLSPTKSQFNLPPPFDYYRDHVLDIHKNEWLDSFKMNPRVFVATIRDGMQGAGLWYQNRIVRMGSHSPIEGTLAITADNTNLPEEFRFDFTMQTSNIRFLQLEDNELAERLKIVKLLTFQRTEYQAGPFPPRDSWYVYKIGFKLAIGPFEDESECAMFRLQYF